MRHIYLDYNAIALKLAALAGEIRRDGHEALMGERNAEEYRRRSTAGAV
ncbi:hypothetical protein [Paenibacillus protaetiae]|nr:hypothetical protein [Paenibacillus protaetiae]